MTTPRSLGRWMQEGEEGAYVVRRRNSNTILLRMPAHMQDLLVKINLVRIGLLPHTLGATSRGGAVRPTALLASDSVPSTLCTWVHRGRDADLLGFEGGLVGLQDDFGVVARLGGVDHEVVVVGACHDVPSVAGEGDFELVEDGVVLVRVAESGAEVLVDRDRLYRLLLHVDVPDLDGQVVAGKDVAAVRREANVGDGGDDFGKE